MSNFSWLSCTKLLNSKQQTANRKVASVESEEVAFTKIETESLKISATLALGPATYTDAQDMCKNLHAELFSPVFYKLLGANNLLNAADYSDTVYFWTNESHADFVKVWDLKNSSIETKSSGGSRYYQCWK